MIQNRNAFGEVLCAGVILCIRTNKDWTMKRKWAKEKNRIKKFFFHVWVDVFEKKKGFPGHWWHTKLKCVSWWFHRKCDITSLRHLSVHISKPFFVYHTYYLFHRLVKTHKKNRTLERNLKKRLEEVEGRKQFPKRNKYGERADVHMVYISVIGGCVCYIIVLCSDLDVFILLSVHLYCSVTCRESTYVFVCACTLCLSMVCLRVPVYACVHCLSS